MTTLTFPVAAVIARLRSIEPIKLIGLAPDLNAAMATPPRNAPAIFVVASTTGGPIKFSGPPTQQERLTTLVLVIWIRYHGEAEAVREGLDAVHAAIDARLAGWSPSNPPFGELEFRASRDQFVHGQYLVAQALYESRWNFSTEVQP